MHPNYEAGRGALGEVASCRCSSIQPNGCRVDFHSSAALQYKLEVTLNQFNPSLEVNVYPSPDYLAHLWNVPPS